MSGFQSPEEFDAWQLAWELKERVAAFTATHPTARDRKFFDEIARGSLGEVRNQLKHARARRYLSDAEFQELSRLCRRAIGASTGLRLYLLSLPKNFDPRKNPKRNERGSQEPGT